MQDVKHRYSSREIADQIGIGHSTARHWANKYDIPATKINGRPLYEEDILDVFQTIKNLRTDGRGFQTIQRKISPTLAPLRQEQEEKNISNDKATLEQQKSIAQAELISNIVTQTVEKSQQAFDISLKNNTDLAEKYARATFEIGQLQERVTGLQTQLEQKETEIKALPPSLEHEKLKFQLEHSNQINLEKDTRISELNELLSELKNKETQLQLREKELESKLQEEQSKSWFQKLFGK